MQSVTALWLTVFALYGKYSTQRGLLFLLQYVMLLCEGAMVWIIKKRVR